MNSTSHTEYLAPVKTIAIDAGKLIMEYFHGGFETERKEDKSLVTEADIAANDYITQQLAALAPDIPIIAEEDAASHTHTHYHLFWLVDPLDGTRAFVAGEPEFTVNIALIENGAPILGVIYSPADNTLYYGSKETGAFKQNKGEAPHAIHVRAKPKDGLTVVRSKSHPSKATEDFLQTLPVKELIKGSSSIKFCQVAEGSADIYPRLGRTMEWDTAAGQAILNAAGGYVVTDKDDILTYGKEGFANPHFIAYGYPR